MATQTTAEAALIDDLVQLRSRFRDEKWSAELYRALANDEWFKEGDPTSFVALSWKRAEEIINALRALEGREPLVLAQTGGEGEVSRTVEEELGRLGWRHRPLDTSEHDPDHVSSPEDPPPASRPPSGRADR
jgi:hypothetical protein